MLPEGAGSTGKSVASGTSTGGASVAARAGAVTPGVAVSAAPQALMAKVAAIIMTIRKITLGIYRWMCLMGCFLDEKFYSMPGMGS
jgi:hypothetical protein